MCVGVCVGVGVCSCVLVCVLVCVCCVGVCGVCVAVLVCVCVLVCVRVCWCVCVLVCVRVFTHRRLNTSNSEMDSPIVATFNVQSLTRFDKFSSRCAESEVNMARKLLPECDTLGPCRLSCTCVDSNLDPFRPLHFNSVNVEIIHFEFTDFNFWFNICWFR